MSTFPGITNEGYTVFDYDEMVLYLEGAFHKNQEFEVTFDMSRFDEIEIQEVSEGIIK